MDYLKEFLRLVHIVGGAFWYGSAILMGFFISPTVSATGEAGQKFMGYLVKNKGITKVIATAAGLTVLAGGILYWIDFRWFKVCVDAIRRRIGIRYRWCIRVDRFYLWHADWFEYQYIGQCWFRSAR